MSIYSHWGAIKKLRVPGEWIDHGRGIINANNFAVRCLDAMAHRKCCCTQRTTQVIALTIGLNIALCKVTNHIDDSGVAGHRAFDHIGKYIDYTLIKREAANLCQRIGINGVGINIVHSRD